MYVHPFLITSRLTDWLKLGMKIMPFKTNPLSCSNSFPSLASTVIMQTSEMPNTSCSFLVFCAMINMPNENVGFFY